MSFSSTISKTKYNISESAWALTGFHGGTGITLGLAYSPLYYEFLPHYSVTQQNGKLCVALDKIKVYFRARPIVFISSEFPRGSCEFNSVLEHENKHVKTLRKMHKKFSKPFKEHVQDIILQARPLKIKSEYQMDGAMDKISAQMQAQLDEYLVDISNELAREQIKVDAPSEYERVNKTCDDWDTRLRAD